VSLSGNRKKNKVAPAAAADQGQAAATLYVVATPIGNLEDITLRALAILRKVSLVAAEDTRHTRKLLAHFSISKPLISYYKDKEVERAGEIVTRLLAGEDVALVSSAGTPAVSDPGAVLVERARQAGIRVVPVPGVSALVTALSVAGLQEGSFLFLGFLPSKRSQRRKLLSSLVRSRSSWCFMNPTEDYRLPARLSRPVRDRRIFLARELTKVLRRRSGARFRMPWPIWKGRGMSAGGGGHH